MKKSKIFITAEIPQELEQKWLQHVRDFDVSHPGCHFEVAMDRPDINIMEAVKKLQVDPALTFAQIFERKKPTLQRYDEDDWD